MRFGNEQTVLKFRAQQTINHYLFLWVKFYWNTVLSALLAIVNAHFHVTTTELSSCHIDFWWKSLEYFYLALYGKGLPTSHTDIAWVFEQMLAWLINKTVQRFGTSLSFFPASHFPWAEISPANVLVSIHSDFGGPAFGKSWEEQRWGSDVL